MKQKNKIHTNNAFRHKDNSANNITSCTKVFSIKSLTAKALYFLSKREYAYAELFTKLQKYTNNVVDVKSVLDYLVSNNYLSEERYLRNYLARLSRKYGFAKIRYMLLQKTTNTDLVDDILHDSTLDEYEIAYAIWHKKFAAVAQNKIELARQTRFLYNHGFSSQTIKAVLKQAGN